MISGVLTIFTFISVILLPWPATALVAIAAAVTEPLIPLAAGLFADTLYYTPASGVPPVFTIGGFLITLLAFFVRARLNTSTMG